MSSTYSVRLYYVFHHSGLPDDTTEEEFIELMSKYGIIMEDNDTS